MPTRHYFYPRGHVGKGWVAAMDVLRSGDFPSVVIAPADTRLAMAYGVFVRSRLPDDLEAFVEEYEAKLASRKVRAKGREWTAARPIPIAEGEWTSSGDVDLNPLAGAAGSVSASTAKRQARRLTGLRRKVVERDASILLVTAASAARGVKFENLATGETGSMTSEEFLSRAVEVVEVPESMTKPIEPLSVADRAFSIATSAMSGPERIRDLYALRKGADEDGRQACDWYVGLIKQGARIKRWEP